METYAPGIREEGAEHDIRAEKRDILPEKQNQGSQTGEQTTKPVRAVLFDLDNTLFDFVKAKLKACDAVISCLGSGSRKELLHFFLRDIWRLEDPEIIWEYMNHHGNTSWSEFERCKEIYISVKKANTYPYPGVSQTLSYLHKNQVILGVVTDSKTHIAREKLKLLQVSRYFTILVTGEMTGTLKPESDIFILALQRLCLPPGQVLFVGDSLYRDMRPSLILGMQTAYAAYGDRNRFDNPCDLTPDYTLHSFRDLMSLSAIQKNGDE